MLSHFNKYSSASFPFLPFRKDLANRCYLFSRTEYLFSNRSAKQLPLSLWLKEERTIPACDKLTLLLWSESDPLSGDSAGVGNGEFSCRKRTFQALSISPKHALTSVVQVLLDQIGSPQPGEGACLCAQHQSSLPPARAEPAPSSGFSDQFPCPCCPPRVNISRGKELSSQSFF